MQSSSDMHRQSSLKTHPQKSFASKVIFRIHGLLIYYVFIFMGMGQTMSSVSPSIHPFLYPLAGGGGGLESMGARQGTTQGGALTHLTHHSLTHTHLRTIQQLQLTSASFGTAVGGRSPQRKLHDDTNAFNHALQLYTVTNPTRTQGMFSGMAQCYIGLSLSKVGCKTEFLRNVTENSTPAFFRLHDGLLFQGSKWLERYTRQYQKAFDYIYFLH